MNVPAKSALATLLVAGGLNAPIFAAGPCENAPYSHFDFWLGKWDVHTPDGKRVGENFIKKAYNGCVVTERYKNKQGEYGTSVNIFDASTGKWYQTWVDKTGLRLQLAGGLEGESMVMTGKTVGEGGQTINHKISWTPEENGSVIQHWQTNSSESPEWKTLFNGVYTKHKD